MVEGNGVMRGRVDGMGMGWVKLFFTLGGFLFFSIYFLYLFAAFRFQYLSTLFPLVTALFLPPVSSFCETVVEVVGGGLGMRKGRGKASQI